MFKNSKRPDRCCKILSSLCNLQNIQHHAGTFYDSLFKRTRGLGITCFYHR